ncbi:MAG: ABC transporter permease [Tissierellia bacterium]|nr:ABC transporter permease [Tissierellia bacterium]
MKKQNRIVFTFISIVLGLLIGGIVLKLSGVSPYEAYKVIILGAFGQPKYISWTLIRAVPIILTGISVAFAFRTGLFNIGAEGQYIVGTIGAVMAGVLFNLPPVIHAIVAILCGALFGAIWGGLVGLFKAKFKVNEVISSIMLNWTALYLNNYVLTFASIRMPESDFSYSIADSASIKILADWRVSEAGLEFLSGHPFIKGFLSAPVNWGLIIAPLIAILAYYILKNTTLGYQLKAVGFNRDAAEYGGINIQKNVMRAMMIAGAFSGLAGATQVLGVVGNIGILAAQQNMGFDGIAVALIAGNNPLACILSGTFFAGLKYGGGKLNTINVPSEIINIIIGIIVLFISMPTLIGFFTKIFKKKDVKEVKTDA